MKVPVSQKELEEHLRQQISFIQSSSALFDAGAEFEAKRIATSIRTLVHDTKNSTSLLKQLHKKGGFLDTSQDFDPSTIGTHGGLVAARFGNPVKWIAPLDDVPFSKWSPFDEWWQKDVFVDANRRSLSRKDLVLTAANQDGGTHVDPELGEVYARLARENFLETVGTDGKISYPVAGALFASIRQVGHEVLKTIDPNYKAKPADLGQGIAMNMTVKAVEPGWRPSPLRREKISRNEPCPCGSGRKYKKCHGRI